MLQRQEFSHSLFNMFIYVIPRPANRIVVLIAYALGQSLCMHGNMFGIYRQHCLLHKIIHAGLVGSGESVQRHQLFRCQLISYSKTDLVCNACYGFM